MKKSVSLFGATFLLSIFFSSCEFEVTTANVNEVKVCTELSGELCNQDQAVFNPNEAQFVASCQLKNAPDDTKVTFVWKYVEGDPIVIDEVTLNSSDYGVNVDMHSSLSRPNNGWPVGKYQVEIHIGDQDDSPEIKAFKVV